MKTIPDNTTQRLLFILHRGLTEIRNLAIGKGNQQIADLADALEILPKYVLHCSGDDMDMIRFVLQDYHARHPESSYDHLAYLEKYEPPEAY